MISNTYKVLH